MEGMNSMGIIRILLLEDNENDKELVKYVLDENLRFEFEFNWVQNKPTFITAIKDFNPDIILSDYNLPQFTGFEALEIAKKHDDLLPFVIVTGTLSEEVAADSILRGAWDYVVKERLHRLPGAIENALKIKGERLRSRQMEAELRLRRDEESVQLRLLWDAFMHAPVSVMITEKDGAVVYVNPQYERISGYKAEEVVGKLPAVVNAGYQDQAFYDGIGSVILAGETWDGEVRNKRKNGESYWEHLTVSPIKGQDGEVKYFVAMVYDITDRKQTEQDLIKAKERAEASDRLKTAFMNNISHEIRTPLNGILGFAPLIQEPGVSEEDKELYLDLLNQSSQRLIQTVTDYMDISLLASNNMVVSARHFLIKDLWNKIEEHYKHTHGQKQIDLSFHLDLALPDLEGFNDPELITKVVHHLIDNAFKFTLNGEITVTGRVDDGQFFISVEDTGVGIDKKNLESIFQHFTQVNNEDTRGHEGSGLGLSIVNGIIELLHGRITVTSEPGKGSTFEVMFCLDYRENKEKHDKEKRDKSTRDAKPLILIAEDDDHNYLFLEIILNRTYRVARVTTGRQAVEFCADNPDVNMILMDIKMPEMNGLEATRKIRLLRPSLPIIAITANAGQGDFEDCLAAGCNDYLAKPVRTEELQGLIVRYLQ